VGQIENGKLTNVLGILAATLELRCIIRAWELILQTGSVMRIMDGKE
jgi:hypothetical protein